MKACALILMVFLALSCVTAHAADYPAPKEGDFVVKNFQFKSGERMAELKLHYYTLGTPQKDANGMVRNAVLILHGTGGSGRQFLTPAFGGVLFGAGQLLDARQYFIILPDNVGHGQSSKPSDGLRMRFPHYEYDDMVELQYRLVTQGLALNHLRLVIGTSMGGMHAWLWGEQHPDFMSALMPLASLPVEIAGRNRIMRKMMMDAIRTDPGWSNGEYKTQPRGLVTALDIMFIMGSSALQLQKDAPTRDKADAVLADYISSRIKALDANDMLYYVDASRNYNPDPQLEKIKVPLTAINTVDDVINPPELQLIEKSIKRIKDAKLYVLSTTFGTRGHGTHSMPAIWQGWLAELLENSGGPKRKVQARLSENLQDAAFSNQRCNRCNYACSVGAGGSGPACFFVSAAS